MTFLTAMTDDCQSIPCVNLFFRCSFEQRLQVNCVAYIFSVWVCALKKHFYSSPFQFNVSLSPKRKKNRPGRFQIGAFTLLISIHNKCFWKVFTFCQCQYIFFISDKAEACLYLQPQTDPSCLCISSKTEQENQLDKVVCQDWTLWVQHPRCLRVVVVMQPRQSDPDGS